jgi:hypothetical protein
MVRRIIMKAKKRKNVSKKEEDLDDPVVAEDKIPAYSVVEEKIRELDSNVIITRTFYLPGTLTYRFQLIKKNKICMMEIPKRLLDNLKVNGTTSEEELKDILKLYIQQPECWTKNNE